MKLYANTHKQRQCGFTLTELIVVVAILGILIAVFGPRFSGMIGETEEMAKYKIAEDLNNCIGGYYTALRLNSNDPTNIPGFLVSGNNMLDVIMDGDVAVVSSAQARFNASNFKCKIIPKLFETTTAATAGTPGVYTYKGTQVTIANGSSDENDIIFASTQSSEVASIAAKYGKLSGAIDTSSVGSAGVVRWDAAASGFNNMTIRLPKI